MRRMSTEELAVALKIDLSPSRLVSVDENKLEEFCRSVDGRGVFASYQPYPWDNRKLYAVELPRSARSQCFAIGNAINFRYWQNENKGLTRVSGVIRGERYFGSEYMWRCLQVASTERKYPILDAFFLRELSEADFDGMFSDDSGTNQLEIGREARIANLRDLGTTLVRNWAGEFWNLVESCERSLVKFSDLSRQFVAYDDPCFKLTMVNGILHSGSGLVGWDADLLPGIDYQLLKQLLRIGILVPGEKLKEKLQGYRLLDSDEAYELRRTALRAFVAMSTRLRISGEVIDNSFFMNRRKCLDDKPVCLSPHTARECPFYEACAQDLAYGIPLENTRYY